MASKSRGRPKKFAEYEDILRAHPAGSMKKRPVYVNGVGVFRGSRGDTAWVKITLPHGGVFKGKSYSSGASLEIKLGKLSSYTWDELERQRDEYQGKADRGDPLEEQAPLTFQDYALDWLSHAQTRTKSDTNRYDVERILLPAFGHMNLSNITSSDIDKWQSRRLKSVKPSTVQRNKNTLKAILNKAVHQELIPKNPCDTSNKIKGTHEYARYYTPEETFQICAAAQELDGNGWFADFILFALYTGMRRGEILSLEWRDVKSLPNGRRVIHIPTSKSGKGRTIPCTGELEELLDRQKDRRVDFLQDPSWRLHEEDDRVFPVSAATVKRRWKRAKEIAGIKQGRMHDWRATNITYALISGVDPKTLTQLTGHRDLHMIDKHYARVVESAISEAAVSTGSYISTALKQAEKNHKKN